MPYGCKGPAPVPLDHDLGTRQAVLSRETPGCVSIGGPADYMNICVSQGGARCLPIWVGVGILEFCVRALNELQACSYCARKKHRCLHTPISEY